MILVIAEKPSVAQSIAKVLGASVRKDGYLEGGFGAKIAAYYGSSDMKVLNFGIKKEFIDRYDASEVLKDNHLTPEQIAEDIAATL